MRVLISTDSSCLLRKDVFKGYEIRVFPLNVIIDGEEFLDGVTIDQPSLEKAMKDGKNIKTSTPPLGIVIEYFEKIFSEGYDHVVHFTISSKLSSMNDLFNNVAKEHFDGKVTIIDSYSLGPVMLSQVFLAYDEIVNKSTSIPETVDIINSLKEDNYFCFIPENLTTLKKGGRISPTAALIGNAIGIKPIILLKDGELQKVAITRHARKTLIENFISQKEKFSPKDYDFNLVTFAVKEGLAEYLIERMESELSGEKVLLGDVPINASAHSGPGTIGLVITKKINGKSLYSIVEKI